MRNFPFFTTEYGIGSLTLREIPYQKRAYIRIHNTSDPGKFLKECLDFCCMAGAETVYADGHDFLSSFPVYTEIWKMKAQVAAVPQSHYPLFPVTEKTINRWREIYNKRMQCVPCAAYMDISEGNRLFRQGEAYFVHDNEILLGIGSVHEGKITCIASVQKGRGMDVLEALVPLTSGDTVELEVASENRRAVRLYEKCGFVHTETVAVWREIYMSSKNT